LKGISEMKKGRFAYADDKGTGRNTCLNRTDKHDSEKNPNAEGINRQ
jgi:hypothetical protein